MTKLNTREILQRLWSDYHPNQPGTVEKLSFPEDPSTSGWYLTSKDSRPEWLGKNEAKASLAIMNRKDLR